MSVQPDTKIKKIEFFEIRQSLWQSNAVAMGSSTSAVSALVTLTTAARAAFVAQQNA